MQCRSLSIVAAACMSCETMRSTEWPQNWRSDSPRWRSGRCWRRLASTTSCSVRTRRTGALSVTAQVPKLLEIYAYLRRLCLDGAGLPYLRLAANKVSWCSRRNDAPRRCRGGDENMALRAMRVGSAEPDAIPQGRCVAALLDGSR